MRLRTYSRPDPEAQRQAAEIILKNPEKHSTCGIAWARRIMSKTEANSSDDPATVQLAFALEPKL